MLKRMPLTFYLHTIQIQSFQSEPLAMPKASFVLSKRHLRRKIQNNVSNALNRFKDSQPTSSTANLTLSLCCEPPESFNLDILTTDISNICSYPSESDKDNNATRINIISDDSNSDTEQIKVKLRQWSLRNHITLTAITELLKILQSHKCHKDLPSDSRALIQTKRTFLCNEVKPGKYVHLGLQKGLELYVKTLEILPKSIEVFVNVDGLPISHSSKSEFWPILCVVRNPEKPFIKKPFCVGIYHGSSKPDDHNEYLKEFVNESKVLQETGFLYNNESIKFKILGFICDSPARAFITCTKYHTGYSSCSKCTQVGERYERRTVFSSTIITRRTDETFGIDEDDEHHRGYTILRELNVGLVSKVPFEFMHLICLGVTKKLLNLWLGGKPKHLKFSTKNIQDISQNLKDLKKCIPGDFNRSPRSLDELPRWKATELRQFLLYVGVIVLENRIPETYMNHFLSLHVAVFVFSNDKLINEYGEYANSLIEYFVSSFEALYGKEHLSYNIHGLLHVFDDVKEFGNLNNYSAFCFENYLGQIKNLVRNGNRPLEQVCRRLSELESIEFSSSQTKNSLHYPHNTGPLISEFSSPQYKKISFKNSFLQVGNRDSFCCLKDGTVIKIINFATSNRTEKLQILGRKCKEISSLYKCPCDSRELGIFSFKSFGETESFDLKEVKLKYFVLQRKDLSFAGFPLHLD
jgi:hypothetical protein